LGFVVVGVVVLGVVGVARVLIVRVEPVVEPLKVRLKVADGGDGRVVHGGVPFLP